MARRADPGLTAEQREAGDETVPTGKKPAVAKAPAAAEGRAFPFVAGAGRQRPRRTAYSATGLFDLRLQWVQVTGLATVPVGLGVGTGRLQLPTTQSVSFGGTVALPLGR
jgi:hypothetical protein